jgi:hypothetical protein
MHSTESSTSSSVPLAGDNGATRSPTILARHGFPGALKLSVPLMEVPGQANRTSRTKQDKTGQNK